MPHLFIINPRAGKRDRARELAALIEGVCGARSLGYELELTKAPGHAALLTASCAGREGLWRVYCCGGDGTLRECAQGAAGQDNIELAPYPTGTGNDFIKSFGPLEPRFRDLDALIEGQARTLDLIENGDMTGLNISSAGFDARIASDVKRFSRLPLVGGGMAYNLSAAYNIVRGIGRRMEIEVDGEKFTGMFTLAAACNGQFYGGGFNPAPDAVLDNDMLDFLIVRGTSRRRAAAVIGKYKRGLYRELPDLIEYRRGKTLRVSAPEPVAINCDGETWEANEARIRVSEKKVRMVVPEG